MFILVLLAVLTGFSAASSYGGSEYPLIANTPLAEELPYDEPMNNEEYPQTVGS